MRRRLISLPIVDSAGEIATRMNPMKGKRRNNLSASIYRREFYSPRRSRKSRSTVRKPLYETRNHCCGDHGVGAIDRTESIGSQGSPAGNPNNYFVKLSLRNFFDVSAKG